MRTHTSYEVSKRLKEFLGKEAPEPMGRKAYITENINGKIGLSTDTPTGFDTVPAYRLEDLLSRPFCEAIWKKVRYRLNGYYACDIKTALALAYYEGSMEAVEAALIKMMDGEGA
jgi:hypothetical protein